MLDKTMQPSTVTRKILFCVVSLSIFLITSSCLVLLRNSGGSYIIPESVLMLVLANKTSEHNTKVRDGDSPLLNSLFAPPLLPLINRRPASRSPGRVRQNAKFEKVAEEEACGKRRSTLKVYVYDLPPDFHFGMLDWNISSSGGAPRPAAAGDGDNVAGEDLLYRPRCTDRSSSSSRRRRKENERRGSRESGTRAAAAARGGEDEGGAAEEGGGRREVEAALPRH